MHALMRVHAPLAPSSLPESLGLPKYVYSRSSRAAPTPVVAPKAEADGGWNWTMGRSSHGVEAGHVSLTSESPAVLSGRFVQYVCNARFGHGEV